MPRNKSESELGYLRAYYDAVVRYLDHRTDQNAALLGEAWWNIPLALRESFEHMRTHAKRLDWIAKKLAGTPHAP